MGPTTEAPIAGPLAPAWFSGQLQPHQAAGVTWLTNHPKAVLADDVGLGKTVQAAYYLGLAKDVGELPQLADSDSLVLWLTEASLIGQTKTELERFLPGFRVLTPLDPEFRESAKAKAAYAAIHKPYDVLICSYEWANSEKRRAWIDERIRPSIVVLDEVSRLKGQDALHATVQEITRAAPRVVSMTATPLENHPMELYGVLAATGTPALWPDWAFSDHYVLWTEGKMNNWGQWEPPRPTGWAAGRASEVRQYLSGNLLQRTVDQVGLALPSIERQKVWLAQSALDKKAYATADRKKGKAAIRGLETVGLGTCLDSFLQSPAMRNGEQSIVYCESLAALELIEKALKVHRVPISRIEGKVNERDRTAAIERFRRGESRVLVASRVLERGLNLQTSRHLASLGSSWNPARERQREGRVRRIGSRFESVSHTTYYLDTPINRSKARALQRKLEMAEAVGLRG